MNSEEASAVAIAPFIKAFTLSVIQTIRLKNACTDQRYCIHADLVPQVSERVMMASMGSQPPRPNMQLVPKLSRPPMPRRDLSALIAPIQASRQMPQRQQPMIQYPQSQPMPPQPQQSQLAPPPTTMQISQDYGKIMPLLNDPSVSTIECPGTGKPILIIRAGQRQMTKIILTPKEIKEVLQKASEAAHIPLLEGVFRAVIDGFSINAVISEMIGSRFVIKKQTPYALLERQF